MFPEVTPKTDFDPAKALDLLDQIQALQAEYAALTLRDAQDDIDLRSHVESHEDSGTLAEGIDPENAMVALYAAGEAPKYLGDDDAWQEATYYAFSAEVTDALERVGLYVSDYDLEDEG